MTIPDRGLGPNEVDLRGTIRFWAATAYTSAAVIVWDAADWPTRDAMDLAYLTGQRPADVLKLMLTDIRDGALWITQGKTGKKLRILVAGELAAVLARIQGDKIRGQLFLWVGLASGLTPIVFGLATNISQAMLTAAANPSSAPQIKRGLRTCKSIKAVSIPSRLTVNTVNRNTPANASQPERTETSPKRSSIFAFSCGPVRHM